jgi:UDP-N-acetylmuramoyl-L-alanyl-D-glutamate--2,6-diaminopimelate ligase
VTDSLTSTLRPQHPSARSLAELANSFGLEVPRSVSGIEVTGITLSTKDLRPGDLFVGLKGGNSHGASFAKAAAKAGAVAILTDSDGALLARDSHLPVVVLESPRDALGKISAWIYGTEQSTPLMFGVTGTNGKTSVTYVLGGILAQLGLLAGISTTAERRIGSFAIPSNLTTPEATELHGMLARMRESEVRAVAIEVSAQALSRKRVDGLVFDVVGFLNLSHDHLDEYRDMESYFQAKVALFEPDRARCAVVSLDSPWGQRVVEGSRIPVTTVSSLEDTPADWAIHVLDERRDGTDFRVTGPDGRSISTTVPVIGWHMACNAALAIVMLAESGFDLEEIGRVLERDGGIIADFPGRLERMSGDAGPAVYVDFAHSPDALATTLTAVRKVTSGRVILMCGADGGRDGSKRREMGKVGSEGSDIFIVCDINPRFEQPSDIRAVLLSGAREAEHPADLLEIPSPSQAIRRAVAMAREGDTVIWAGPGHEDYFEVLDVKHSFSSREQARLALREAGWA